MLSGLVCLSLGRQSSRPAVLQLGHRIVDNGGLLINLFRVAKAPAYSSFTPSYTPLAIFRTGRNPAPAQASRQKAASL